MPDAKRPKNVFVVQGHNGQSIIQEVSGLEYTDHRISPIDQMTQDTLQQGVNMLNMDPASPITDIKKEPKSKSSSPKNNTNLNKSINGPAIPSSKTCNWVFENGQVCGKTFSKSYNLVVHMRMHEDIRPFACTLCDQTFRQKAHLQRHETTHGIQSKNIYRQPAASGGSKKSKKKKGQTLSKGLQNRLAKINQNLNKANGEDSAGEDFIDDEEVGKECETDSEDGIDDPTSLMDEDESGDNDGDGAHATPLVDSETDSTANRDDSEKAETNIELADKRDGDDGSERKISPQIENNPPLATSMVDLEKAKDCVWKVKVE